MYEHQLLGLRSSDYGQPCDAGQRGLANAVLGFCKLSCHRCRQCCLVKGTSLIWAITEHDLFWELSGSIQVAELFNNYFVHIVDDVQDIKEHNFGNDFSAHPSIRAIAEENRRKNAIHNFNFKYTNKTQVQKLLSNINARKACGHDTITPRLPKESASAISGPLAESMNESIKQCKYPS